MKAALNGVPSLSVLDGWWLEGCIEGVTGWAIGPNHRGLAADDDRTQDAAALYNTLEQVIVPLFYDEYAGLHQCHASCHRAQWLLFQYPTHIAAIRGEGVLSVNHATVSRRTRRCGSSAGSDERPGLLHPLAGHCGPSRARA